MKAGYQQFKTNAMTKYQVELHRQNGLDAVLYRLAVDALCGTLHEYRLWEVPSVRQYWDLKAPMKSSGCP
jgi:hypothetical protein